MRRRNVFAMGLALAIGGAGAAFLVDNTVAAPPPLLQLLSPPGAGYDSTNGVLYTGSGQPVTFTRADTWTCRDSDGTIRSLASGAPCVVDGHDGAGSLRVRSAVANLALQSEALETASWTLLNATVSADQTLAPSGAVVADKILETTASSQHGVYQSIAVAANTVYTQSAYLKQAERTWAWMTEGNTLTATVYFNLATCTVGTVSGTGAPSASAEAAGNGFCRVALTFTTGDTQTSANLQIRTATGDGGATFAGDSTKGIFAWGAQMVAGSQPGDYCPTGASSDTCAAETATADFKGGVAPAASPWCVSARVTRATGDAAWNAGASSRRVWTNDATGNGHAFVDVSTAGAVRLAVGDSAGTEKVWTAANALTDNTSANVRVCYSGSAGTVWVDGVSVAAAESGAGTGVLPSLTLTNYVGSTADGTLQLNASLDTLCFSSSPNGCQ